MALTTALWQVWRTMNEPLLPRVAILGTGNMGTAIIRGLVKSETIPASSIVASDTDETKLHALKEQFGIGTTANNRELVRSSNVVILAVKPQIMNRVLEEIEPEITNETRVFSIAAGVTSQTLESSLGHRARVVRAMPNTPAIALASITAIAKGTRATPEDVKLAHTLFEAIGRVVEVDEPLIDAVTGLSGSGPAYVLLALEALSDGGVRMGLPRATAQLLAAQTIFGTAKMVLESSLHPAQLRDAVTSPGGTTIAGLCALEAAGVRNGFISAVTAATERSIELGKIATQKR
jgi:pyrroline-5-carboxylate reductase